VNAWGWIIAFGQLPIIVFALTRQDVPALALAVIILAAWYVAGFFIMAAVA
jgi:hypothetical protein